MRLAENQLWIESVPASELVTEFGTPLLVFSAARLRRNAEVFRTIFGANRVLYSYKACYVPAVLRLIHAEAIGAEVGSQREYALARLVGLDPDRIAWNSAALTDGDARLLARVNPAYVGVNTVADLRRLQSAADEEGVSVTVLLRIAPAGGSKYLASGGKLGLAEHRALRLMTAASSLNRLKIKGLHCHAHIEETDPRAFALTLAGLVSLAERVRDRSRRDLTLISVGGGFTSRSRFPDNRDIQMVARDFAKIGKGFEVVVEPGRAIVSDAGVALASVIAFAGGRSDRWALIDFSTSVLMPLHGRQFEVRTVVPSGLPARRIRIGDAISSFSGVLNGTFELPPLRLGDPLAIPDAGAYTYSAAQHFVHGVPNVVVVDGEQRHLVSHAELPEAWASRLDT